MPETGPDWGKAEIQRLLIICLGDAANILALGPALHTLQQTFPQATIRLLTTHPYHSLSSLLPGNPAPLRYPFVNPPAPWLTPSLKGNYDSPKTLRRFIKTLRAHAFQFAVCFTAPGESPYGPAYLCYLAGIPIRMGQSSEFGGGLLSRWIKPLAPGSSDLEHHRHLLEALGPTPDPIPFQLQIPKTLEEEITAALASVQIGTTSPFLILDSEGYAPTLLAQATQLPVLRIDPKHRQIQCFPASAAPAPLPARLAALPRLIPLIARSAGVLSDDPELIRIADLLQRPWNIPGLPSGIPADPASFRAALGKAGFIPLERTEPTCTHYGS